MRTLLLVVILAAVSPAQKIVILAGSKDDHPRRTHEYLLAARWLQHRLVATWMFPAMRVLVCPDGWPTKPEMLDDADTIVVISAGSDRRRDDHPLLVGGRWHVMRKQMKRGCGLVAIHWTTFVPRAVADDWLDWVGGHFDYESGPPPRRWASKIRTARARLEPVAEHPILRGVATFEHTEELYYDIRFKKDDPRRTPLLHAKIEGVAAAKEVAWAVEREDGGRGFAYTGGHFLTNWADPPLVRMLCNAVMWTAKKDVPETGWSVPEGEQMRVMILTGHNHPAHAWRKTTAAIQAALECDPRITVEIATDPNKALTPERLTRCSVVVQNYCNWEQAGLSDGARQACLAFVDGGGGLVVVHFANGAWHRSLPKTPVSHWPAYHERLVRRAWDHDGESGHDPYGRFRVRVTSEPHRITADLKDFETTDELYFRQAGELRVRPLLVARSMVTGREEPLAFAYDVGKGRVFQTLLGHDDASLRVPAMQEILRRSVAWTARRRTFKLPVK